MGSTIRCRCTRLGSECRRIVQHEESPLCLRYPGFPPLADRLRSDIQQTGQLRRAAEVVDNLGVSEMGIHETKSNHSCADHVNYSCASVCDHSVMGKLAEKLKRLRMDRGMDLTGVAGEVAISRQAYHKIEDGSVENPKIDTLIALARLYGTSVSELIDDPALAYRATELQVSEPAYSISDIERDLVQTFRQADKQQQELILALVAQLKPRKSVPNRRLPMPGKATSAKKVPPGKKQPG